MPESGAPFGSVTVPVTDTPGASVTSPTGVAMPSMTWTESAELASG